MAGGEKENYGDKNNTKLLWHGFGGVGDWERLGLGRPKAGGGLKYYFL